MAKVKPPLPLTDIIDMILDNTLTWRLCTTNDARESKFLTSGLEQNSA